MSALTHERLASLSDATLEGLIDRYAMLTTRTACDSCYGTGLVASRSLDCDVEECWTCRGTGESKAVAA